MRASDLAYQSLKDDIIQWRLEPGSPLGEIETAQRLGVSRTPVREALSRLTAEGLVATGSGRTAMVALVSIADVRQLFEYREALETQAARLAAARRSSEVFQHLRDRFLEGPSPDHRPGPDRPYFLADKLDEAIDETIANPYLVNAMRDLRGHLARYRRHAHTNPRRLEQATCEHLLIVEAILDGDERLAAQATAVHLHKSLENILGTVPALQREPELEASAV